MMKGYMVRKRLGTPGLKPRASRSKRALQKTVVRIESMAVTVYDQFDK